MTYLFRKEIQLNKILVIEDDDLVRNNIIELLNEEGYETYQAENGKIGIEKAYNIYPDLILSDILMPEADGYTVLKEIQKRHDTSSIPFIFLSARTGTKDIRMGMNIGADDYLTKPYKAEDLLAAIRSRLKKKNDTELKLNQIFKSISLSLPHEFRTPLVPILGYSQIISESINELPLSEICDMAEKINSSGYELLNMIEKFLILSKLETLSSSKQQFEPGKISNNIKNNILSIASAEAERTERASDLNVNIKDGSVEISEEHFEILFKELIENAFKFSSKGTPITVLSYYYNNSYYIKITDKGIGIKQEYLNEFGVFRQFDRNKNCQTGTGLGLAIAFKIADIYKIKINIQSEVKKSTTINILIPSKTRKEF